MSSTSLYELEKNEDYLRNYKPTRNISPLRYAGGKTKAVNIILSYLPKLRQKKIVSPFFGGGSFELTLSSELGFEVVGYDVFAILVNFWNQAINHSSELADALSALEPNAEDFDRNRHILLSYWEKVKPESLVYNTRNRLELTDEEKTRLDNDQLLQATYYYYNMQLSYGPMFLGWPSSVYLNETKYTNMIERIRNFKPGNVRVLCDSFENVIPRHKDDFLFLDPPYYLGEDSKMFKGMYPNCNFAIHHNTFNHTLLCDLLKKHTGGFLLTYNDCPTIRELYKDYIQEFPSWHYSYGQGEKRIGKNREHGTNDNVKKSHEIFIICPPK